MIAHTDTYRFSAADYRQLIETGILDKTDRVELLDGEIILMAPIGRYHAKAVRKILRRLHQVLGDQCLIDCQTPFDLDEFSEPQPDILLLRLQMEQSDELPRPEDVYLAIEVSDSTLRYDSGPKLRAYARGGIREYWIVNLTEARIDVWRQPQGETYAEHFRRQAGETLAPAAFPDRPLAVADILP